VGKYTPERLLRLFVSQSQQLRAARRKKQAINLFQKPWQTQAAKWLRRNREEKPIDAFRKELFSEP
jgi:hypothetical protein